MVYQSFISLNTFHNMFFFIAFKNLVVYSKIHNIVRKSFKTPLIMFSKDSKISYAYK